MTRIYFLAMILIALSACSKNEPTPTPEIEPETETTKIPITISNSVWARVTDSAYEQGDKVGIYIVNYDGTTAGTLATSGNHATNMPFTYESSSWTSETELYWKDKETHADFYCYFPYDASQATVSAYSFSVLSDQSTEANYKASELLWGKATDIEPTEYAVPITTNHSMSNIIIKLSAGKGYTDETLAAEVKDVLIMNTQTASTINLADGTVTATGPVADIVPLDEGTQYRALVVPQTIDNKPLVKITINGIEYILTASETFVGNKQHTCTITIDMTSGGVNVGIGGWETDDTDFGGTAI